MKISKIYLIRIFKSHYCKAVFALSFILSYFLLSKKIFYGWYSLLGIGFMAMFALTVTCIVRNIKERVVLKRTSGGSIISLIAVSIGLAALEVCGVGAPVCGATVGLGLFATLIPGVALGFFETYGTWVVIGTIFLQLIALYFMNCFERVGRKSRVSLRIKV